MDGPLGAAAGDGAIRAHFGLVARGRIVERGSGREQPELDQSPEGNARLRPLALGNLQRGGIESLHALQPFAGGIRIGRLAFDADKGAAQALGGDSGGTRSHERIEHDVAHMARRQNDALKQRLRLLCRVGLAPVLLQPFGTRADRQQPIGAHLQIFVQRLHGFVVESVTRLLTRGRPDHRLMRIGEAPSAKIRHRVGLAPDDIVQHPVAEILERRADAEDIVIAADDPEAAVRLQHPAAGAQPFAGETVIGAKAGELIPFIVDAVDAAVIGPVKLVRELKVIGRIGEHEIDAPCGQLLKFLDAIADNDLVARKPRLPRIPQTHDSPLALRRTNTRLPFCVSARPAHAGGVG